MDLSKTNETVVAGGNECNPRSVSASPSQFTCANLVNNGVNGTALCAGAWLHSH